MLDCVGFCRIDLDWKLLDSAAYGRVLQRFAMFVNAPHRPFWVTVTAGVVS